MRGKARPAPPAGGLYLRPQGYLIRTAAEAAETTRDITGEPMTYADKGADPKPMVPGVRGLYENIAEFYWPLIRITAGAVLFTHGWPKLMAGAQAFAAGSLARRGLEPSLLLAYIVIFLETAGAILIMLGLFTRPIAALLVIEFAVILWVDRANGWSWTNRGAEYPLLWGIVFLAMVLRGGGPYSLDRKLGKEV